MGYAGMIGPPYCNQGSHWTNLYWVQHFNQGKSTFVGGYLDTTDYADTFIGGTPWTAFTNFIFSTGSASMSLPNDARLGMAAASVLTDNVYVIGGITNAYEDSTDPLDDGFDRFVSDNEYFTRIEVGWTKGQERIYFDNAHLTFWHVDDSVLAGTIEGWGVVFSYITPIDDKWLTFVHGGYVDDGGNFLQKSLGVGFLYKPDERLEFSIGLNWGEPNETTFVPGLDDQYMMEAFYRFQLTQQFALTLSVESLKNPALNPDDDKI